MADVAATVAASELRVEIVGERRRAYDAAFRSRVVMESFLPGVRAAGLAQRHGICKSLVYRWRRLEAPGAPPPSPPVAAFEMPVLGRDQPVPVCQKAGSRPVRLAASCGRRDGADAGAAGVAGRGDGLAADGGARDAAHAGGGLTGGWPMG